MFAAIARRGRLWLPLVGAAALVGTLGALALPAVLGRVVDATVAGADAGRWLAVAGGLIALGIACDLVEVYAGTACAAGTTAWLRHALVRHTLAAGPDSARRFDTGDLVTRISSNATDAAQAGLSVVLISASVLPPVGALVLLAAIDPVVAAAFLAGVGLVGLVLRGFSRRTTQVVSGYQRTQGGIAARLAEALAGARTIAAAGTVPRERRRILADLPELRRHGTRTWAVLARTSAQAGVVGPLVLVAVLAAAGLALVAGRITPGELFAASRYAVLGAGLGGLTGIVGRLARARAGARRVAEVLRVPPVRYGTASLPPGPGLLEFRDVTVLGDPASAGQRELIRDFGTRHAGRHAHELPDQLEQTPVLAGVSLAVPGGAAVAVVGRSGAGKSTLAALAARLRDPDAGEVRLDGVPLAALRHDELRAAVGCAFERPVLVGDTVGDAVGMGRDPATVAAAARAAHAHEFVSRLPSGYGTPLADAPMSGGETQRLGLARALPAARLLVLDDATSSLDMVTEMQIARALTERRGRTRLIVTHRAATAARADLVVWLDGGRLRGVGPHGELWGDPDYRAVFG